jgi:hypothetical protein
MMTLATILALLRRVPKPIWYVLMAIFAIALLARWHGGKVAAAYAEGAVAQAQADDRRVRAASAAAEAAQNALRTQLAARQDKVTKGTDNALLAKTDDLARRYDDLRLRWAAYRADQGRAGESGAIAVSGTATGADDAACAANGWVSFDTAAAAAKAADTAIARDDAWRAWVTAQAAAWPE